MKYKFHHDIFSKNSACLFALSLFTLIWQGAIPQSRALPIKIGQRVPDVALSNMINYRTTEAKLSDFKGKLLILDFFDVGCGSCIAAFPEMEELQRRFGQKIQILLVTADSRLFVGKLIKQSPIAKETRLPFVTGNSKLYSQLFRHTSDPYHVWISESGIVKAITSGYNTTAENISNYFSNSGFLLPVRNDCPDWDDQDYKSLMQEGNGRQLKYLQSSSVLMRYIPCIRVSMSGFATDSATAKPIGLKIINCDMLGLYKYAYNGTIQGFETYSDDRIILNVRNPDRYLYPKDESEMDTWKPNNFFCYELRIPSAISWTFPIDSVAGKLREMMRQDLDRYFFKASQQKVTRRCWVIVRTNVGEKLKGSGGKSIFEHTKNGYVVRNMSIDNIMGQIQIQNRGINTPPLINETDYTNSEEIDMDINCALTDIPQLCKELAKYGLNIIEADRQIDVLILSENK
jgi:hypothetical protein